MRIAIWHNQPSGGSKRALHDQVRGLVERGHSVEAWCPSTTDRSYLPLDRYCPEHTVPLEPPTVLDGGRLARFTKCRRELAAKIAAADGAARLCADQIRGGGFDLLLAHPCHDFSAPSIGKYVDIPSVLYLQEPRRILYECLGLEGKLGLPWIAPVVPPRVPIPPASIPPFDRLLRAKYRANWFLQEFDALQALRNNAREELVNARAFDLILCNSRFSRESIARAYGLESRVSYLGIDVESFRPAGPKEPYVVGLGSMQSPKRLDVAVRAVGAIPSASRPRLVWIGNVAATSYVESIRALAADLGVSFEARTMVSQEELVEALGRAAVMVYAPYLEPFGYAPLEANACGTWAVGVAEGGLRESICDGENGDLVDGLDYEKLGRAIRRQTDDLALATSNGLRARRYVERHWSLAGSLNRLEDHLHLAAQRPCGSAPLEVPC